MQQILFHVPFTAGLVPPDGVPVHGFGVVLFAVFVLTAMVWGPVRAARVGLPKDRLQDLAIALFLVGIAGARAVYMLQYPSRDAAGQPLPWFPEFFKIWKGGIVLYGALVGGAVAYAGFYWVVVRRLGVSAWRLADALAPLVAAGIAVGRVGCYLNGCCWGQPVCEEARPIPLLVPALGEFPLLPAPAREQVVEPARPKDGQPPRMPQIHALQTATGFAAGPPPAFGTGDPRTVVDRVEPGSAAERAGLRPGERVVGVNGEANRVVVKVGGRAASSADVAAAADQLLAAGGVEYPAPERLLRPDDQGKFRWVAFETPEVYRAAVAAARPKLATARGLAYDAHDVLWELVADWPRGRNRLDLVVDRGKSIEVSFTPRTVAFFPTQLYETVSMTLLIGVLLAFQPFRRHDGQVFVLFMVGYAAHRLVNEALRIEPTYQLGLTLSQWISVGMVAGAAGLELYLRRTQPRLPPGPVPLGYGAAPARPAGPVPPPAAPVP